MKDIFVIITYSNFKQNDEDLRFYKLNHRLQ